MKSSPIWRNDDRHSTRHWENNKSNSSVEKIAKLQSSDLDLDNLFLEII